VIPHIVRRKFVRLRPAFLQETGLVDLSEPERRRCRSRAFASTGSEICDEGAMV
jgi:hypothetical protein